MMVAQIMNPNVEEAENREIKYITGKQGWERDTWVEVKNMEEGDYYLYVEHDWPEKQEHTEFAVSCYGQAKSFFLRDEKSLFSKEKIIEMFLTSQALEGKCENMQTKSFESQGADNLNRYFGMSENGYGFVLIDN
jgi:hypothetical protein